MKKMRFGIIGTGRHGSRYIRHITRDIAEAEFTAFSRKNRESGERLARESGATFHPDWCDLVNSSDVDAIVLAATTDLHEPVAMAAIEAQKPLLIEKPLARNSIEGRRICEAAEKAGTTIMVAQTLRYNGVVSGIKQFLPSIGPIHMLSFSQRMEPHGLPWLDDPELAGGGNLLHTGIHLMDLAGFFLGRIEIQDAWCRLERIYNQQTEDLFVAVLKLHNGTTIVMDASKVSSGRAGRIEAIGEKGQLSGDHVRNELFILDEDGYKRIELPAPRFTVLATLQDFMKAVTTDTPPAITCRDGLSALESIDLCYDSCVNGLIEYRNPGPHRLT